MRDWAPHLTGWGAAGSFSFDSGSDATVRSVVVDGSAVYVGGGFTRANGKQRTFAAAFDLRTPRLRPWNPAPLQSVEAIAVNGRDAALGGNFSGLGGVARANLAAIDVATRRVTSWNPGVAAADGAAAFSLALDGKTLYVGGSFKRSAGQPRDGLAAFDTSTGRLNEWRPGALQGNGLDVDPGARTRRRDRLRRW